MSPPPHNDPPASSGVVAETHAHLAALDERYSGNFRKQMVELYLLGVEREQIVAVAYREDTLAERIEALPADDAVRSVVRHAMRWIWKEEQMHTIFIRGALLRNGSLWLRAKTFVQQLTGAIAGWSTAVLHHVRWSKAPLSRLFAHIFTFVGFVMGKVPRPVLAEMRHVSFYDYCRFSLEAERTAAICWERVSALAKEAGDDENTLAPYRRMAADERNHERIFELFLAAFDEEGALRSGWSAERMAERVAAIGEFYLPPSLRPSAKTMPLGRGGNVVVHAAAPDEDKAAALQETLSLAGLEALLEERADALGKPVSELSVAIKATFMRGYSHRDRSSFTDPTLVSGLVRELRHVGVADVALLETASIYDWYFERRDVMSVARYLGYDIEGARVVDIAEEVAAQTSGRGTAALRVSATWRDADVRIAFGKLSSHPVDQIYLSFAQLECLSAQAYELVFVERQAHRGQAVAAITGEFPPHFAMIDAFDAVAHGLMGIIACPDPLAPRRIYAGRDALAVDITAARHVGEEVEDSEHLSDAIQWFDDPRGRITVSGCDESIAGWKSPTHNEWTAVLSLLSYPVYLLLSGRGSLFVPEMDREAFPPIGRPGWALRGARRFLRWMLGTRLPR